MRVGVVGRPDGCRHAILDVRSLPQETGGIAERRDLLNKYTYKFVYAGRAGVRKMGTEVVEEAPICAVHGIKKHRQNNRSLKRGWQWVCGECSKGYKAKYREGHPEQKGLRRYSREDLERVKKWSKEHPENRRRARRKYLAGRSTIGEFTVTNAKAGQWYTRYRLRPEDVLELYEAQGRRCMFGGEPLDWNDIHVDHKHGYPGCNQGTRGAEYRCPKESVRGLSCDYHNILEGQLSANPEGFMDLVRWHIKNNGIKQIDLCGCAGEEKTDAA